MNKNLLLYITGLFFGSMQGIAASFISLSSYEIVLMRSVMGGIGAVTIFFASGGRLSAYRNRRDVLFIVLSGISMALNWLLFYRAYTLIGVGLATILNFCAPIIVVVVSPLIFQERLTFRKLLALVLAVAGAFLISGQAVSHGLSLGGILIALAAMVLNAAMVILNKMTKEIKGLDNAALELAVAPVVVLLFMALRGGLGFSIPAADWLPLLWLGAVSTTLNNVLYFSTIGKLPAQTVALVGYLEPVAATVLAAFILKEKLTPLQILGAFLILGGAVWGECGVRRET